MSEINKKENQFFVDSKKLSETALKRKHEIGEITSFTNNSSNNHEKLK